EQIEVSRGVPGEQGDESAERGGELVIERVSRGGIAEPAGAARGVEPAGALEAADEQVLVVRARAIVEWIKNRADEIPLAFAEDPAGHFRGFAFAAEGNLLAIGVGDDAGCVDRL